MSNEYLCHRSTEWCCLGKRERSTKRYQIYLFNHYRDNSKHEQIYDYKAIIGTHTHTICQLRYFKPKIKKDTNSADQIDFPAVILIDFDMSFLEVPVKPSLIFAEDLASPTTNDKESMITYCREVDIGSLHVRGWSLPARERVPFFLHLSLWRFLEVLLGLQ
jgi:hypothetical protein